MPLPSSEKLWLKDAAASGSNHGSLQDGGAAPTVATTATGWTAPAAPVYRASWVGGDSSGTGDRTCTVSTPAVGDLLIVWVVVTANSNDTPTCSDDNSGSYDRILTRTCGGGGGSFRLSCFVRTALMTNTTSTVVTPATGTNNSGSVVVTAISGMTRAGSAAVRQSAGQNVTVGPSAPAPAFGSACLTGNVTLGAVGNAANPAAMTAPTNWTERQDTGQASDTCGLEVVTRDSGFTGTTVTWGSTTLAYGDIIIELDCSFGTLYELQDYAATATVDETAAKPDASPNNTIGDSWRSESAITRAWLAGDWQISIPVIMVGGAGGTADGRLRFRLWRSANQNGSSATEITSGTTVTSAYTDLAGTQQILTATVTLALVALNAEYLFFQVAFEATGFGGAGEVVTIRVGYDAWILPPDECFDPARMPMIGRSYPQRSRPPLVSRFSEVGFEPPAGVTVPDLSAVSLVRRSIITTPRDSQFAVSLGAHDPPPAIVVASFPRLREWARPDGQSPDGYPVPPHVAYVAKSSPRNPPPPPRDSVSIVATDLPPHCSWVPVLARGRPVVAPPSRLADGLPNELQQPPRGWYVVPARGRPEPVLPSRAVIGEPPPDLQAAWYPTLTRGRPEPIRYSVSVLELPPEHQQPPRGWYPTLARGNPEPVRPSTFTMGLPPEHQQPPACSWLPLLARGREVVNPPSSWAIGATPAFELAWLPSPAIQRPGTMAPPSSCVVGLPVELVPPPELSWAPSLAVVRPSRTAPPSSFSIGEDIPAPLSWEARSSAPRVGEHVRRSGAVSSTAFDFTSAFDPQEIGRGLQSWPRLHADRPPSLWLWSAPFQWIRSSTTIDASLPGSQGIPTEAASNSTTVTAIAAGSFSTTTQSAARSVTVGTRAPGSQSTPTE